MIQSKVFNYVSSLRISERESSVAITLAAKAAESIGAFRRSTNEVTTARSYLCFPPPL